MTRHHHLRDLSPRPLSDPISEGSVDSAGGGTDFSHLEHAMTDSAQRFEAGQWQEGISSLAHAVYVGAFKGPQGLTEFDVIRLIRRVVGAGYHPDDEGSEAA